MSAEPNWLEWAHTLASVMDRLARNAATVEAREAVWRAMVDFDRQCRAWRHQPDGWLARAVTEEPQ